MFNRSEYYWKINFIPKRKFTKCNTLTDRQINWNFQAFLSVNCGDFLCAAKVADVQHKVKPTANSCKCKADGKMSCKHMNDTKTDATEKCCKQKRCNHKQNIATYEIRGRAERLQLVKTTAGMKSCKFHKTEVLQTWRSIFHLCLFLL